MHANAPCLPGAGLVGGAAERATTACAAGGETLPAARAGFIEPDRDRAPAAADGVGGTAHGDQNVAARGDRERPRGDDDPRRQ